jgi:hypothetical protein
MPVIVAHKSIKDLSSTGPCLDGVNCYSTSVLALPLSSDEAAFFGSSHFGRGDLVSAKLCFNAAEVCFCGFNSKETSMM